jgi:CMP-N,N'-diacetyllegionaminic acid synthase
MYLNERVLAIIPARKNSKGLPGKNIKNFLGSPLFKHSIDQARDSNLIDEILVTSDCEEVISIASRENVMCIERPHSLATDTSHTPDAIFHAVNTIKQAQKIDYNLIVMLQPTSPLRSHIDIDNSIRMLKNPDRKAIVSVCEASCNLNYVNGLPKDMNMENFLKVDGNASNRQYYKKNYQLNGAVYVAWYDYFLQNKGFYGSKTYAYIMPRERSVDIDTSFDFKLAEFFGRGQEK